MYLIDMKQQQSKPVVKKVSQFNNQENQLLSTQKVCPTLLVKPVVGGERELIEKGKLSHG